MAKRPSLAASMRQAATPEPEAPANNKPPAKASHALEPSPESPARATGFYAATRAGKKKVTASVTPEAHKQLRQLGLDHDKTNEGLLVEALNDLFKKYGKRAIA